MWILTKEPFSNLMPTSTAPYEVVFELTNDTSAAATIQLARHGSEPSGGSVVLLQQGESISLVLNAGSTYYYRLRQGDTQAWISVKTWQDTQCKAAGFLSEKKMEHDVWAPDSVVTCYNNHRFGCD